jgi:hypothetical protein
VPADYALGLPASDERIPELTTLGVGESMFNSLAGDSAEHGIAGFRFHRADDDAASP